MDVWIEKKGEAGRMVGRKRGWILGAKDEGKKEKKEEWKEEGKAGRIK